MRQVSFFYALVVVRLLGFMRFKEYDTDIIQPLSDAIARHILLFAW